MWCKNLGKLILRAKERKRRFYAASFIPDGDSPFIYSIMLAGKEDEIAPTFVAHRYNKSTKRSTAFIAHVDY